VVNAAYFKSQFWDGRATDLEDQSKHPFINPVEMGLKKNTNPAKCRRHCTVHA
jgi:cytochrome c peroxidase